MNIQEAVELGIERLRKKDWSDKTYIRIHINDGLCGPWFEIYDRLMQEIIGANIPQRFLLLTVTDNDFEEHTGEIDKDDK